MTICINPYCCDSHNSDTLIFCQSCGSELLLDGRYRTVRCLGGGGSGKTYEVLDCVAARTLDTHNRFKVLKVLIHNQPKYVELFQREAQVLAQLNHPGIPNVEADDYFIYQPENVQEQVHCLVMEKIEGLNLLEYTMQRRKVIEQKRAIRWLIQLTSILREVHSKNFFHRDIKPSNIMLQANGQLVLIDFGSVRQITETLVSKQAQGQVTGVISTGYTPTEQMYGQAVPQSDFFALGRTFVYLLTGQEPNELYDPLSDTLRWREATSDVSPLLADFLDRLMARLPQERPKTAVDILEELTKIYDTLYPNQGGSGAQTLTYLPQFLASNVEATQTLMPEVSAHQPRTESTDAEQLGASKGAFEISSNSSTAPTSSSPPPKTEASLQPELIARCQEELAELIGPIASIICKRTLKSNAQLSAREFIAQLAQKIPNQQQAHEFKKRLLNFYFMDNE